MAAAPLSQKTINKYLQKNIKSNNTYLLYFRHGSFFYNTYLRSVYHGSFFITHIYDAFAMAVFYNTYLRCLFYHGSFFITPIYDAFTMTVFLNANITHILRCFQLGSIVIDFPKYLSEPIPELLQKKVPF